MKIKKSCGIFKNQPKIFVLEVSHITDEWSKLGAEGNP